MSSFIPSFIEFVQNNKDPNYPSTAKEMKKHTFNRYLLDFFQDPEGKAWIPSFKFDASLQPWNFILGILPNLKAITFEYNHINFKSSDFQIKAMNMVFDILKKYEEKVEPGVGRLFAYSGSYTSLITTEVISHELIKNIS